MEDKIKVSAVSYLNTKPLTYGFDKTSLKDRIELNYDYPANVAKALINKTTDIGLVPVAVIPLIPNAQIISDYCIAANDDVVSVAIYSNVPIEEITHLYLDYQSRTSVKLAQILLKEYWKKEDVKFLQADEHFIEKIDGKTAAVIIGDRAMHHLNDFPYVYDLSLYWNKMTGLPFVFAAWVGNKHLSDDFIREFNKANEIGFLHIDEVVAENDIDYYDLKKYFTQNIFYKFDEENKKGLQLFLKKIYPNFNL